MKIGLLTTGFPRFEGDCSGSFLLSLARGLVEHGHTFGCWLRSRAAIAQPRVGREST